MIRIAKEYQPLIDPKRVGKAAQNVLAWISLTSVGTRTNRRPEELALLTCRDTPAEETPSVLVRWM